MELGVTIVMDEMEEAMVVEEIKCSGKNPCVIVVEIEETVVKEVKDSLTTQEMAKV